MTAQTVYREIETLSPVQLENVYSYICRIKQPQNTYKTERIEPFANEQEVLDFINDYAERMINAEG